MAERELQPTELDSLRIKERAFAEGFDAVAIVAADALVTEGQRLREWLGRGFHGEMSWMARDAEKRTDPRLLFPAARSVIVVALNYYTPHRHAVEADQGKISRYAWGDDYHDVVGEKLQGLLDWIKDQCPGANGRVCVDIQPMMDKAWAVLAGLGWIGKHSNLITREYGSWVFLGELLLDLDLEYDSEQVADHCGSCTICIDECPTNAITEPCVVDSNRCISYATIELRSSEIPETVAENLNGWLYGCDVCQEVCPWNRFEQPSPETRFEPRDGRVGASLTEIIGMTPDLYAERFRRSAIKRAKLSGLQRNARTLLKRRRPNHLKSRF